MLRLAFINNEGIHEEIDIKDCGRDYVTPQTTLLDNIYKVIVWIIWKIDNVYITILPQKGVIIGKLGDRLCLSLALGGYVYSLEEETKNEIISILPLKTAVFDIGTKTNTILESVFALKYKITHIKDKVNSKFTELESPLIKTFYIKLHDDICIGVE